MDDSEGVNRREGSIRKTVVDCDSLRDAIREHARRHGVGAATVRRTVAKVEAKSRVIVERPLLTPANGAKRLENCPMLVNDIKSVPA